MAISQSVFFPSTETAFPTEEIEGCYFEGTYWGISCSGRVDSIVIEPDGTVWLVSVRDDSTAFTTICEEWWWRAGDLIILCDNHGMIIVPKARMY